MGKHQKNGNDYLHCVLYVDISSYQCRTLVTQYCFTALLRMPVLKNRVFSKSLQKQIQNSTSKNTEKRLIKRLSCLSV